VTAGTISKTGAWRDRYDTIVITDAVYPSIANELRSWVVKNDGNLILLDRGLGMLQQMKVINGDANATGVYAGYTNFQTTTRETTYGDPLARGINQPGAAEGQEGDEVRRRQTYEPVALGFAIQTPDGDDAYNSPVWFVPQRVLSKSDGKARAIGTTVRRGNVSFGEVKLGGGRIRFLGALLPMPSERFDHPYGLGDYALTYSGYQLLKNMLQWSR
jgi:hypothetical protein